MSVIQPGTSCGLGRSVMQQVIRHSQSPNARIRNQRRYSVRAYSPVTHRHYLVQVHDSTEVAFWNTRLRIAGSGSWD